HDLPPGVICLEREPAARALRQRDIHTMVAGCTLIEPLSAAADGGVRAVSRRVVQRSLRPPPLCVKLGWIAIRACPTADASLRVLADHRHGCVGILIERSVVGLAPHIAHRKHEVSHDAAFDRQAPLLAGGCEQDRIDTLRAVETTSRLWK